MFSGPPVRSLALRPGDSQSSLRRFCRWASGHWFPSSLPSKLQGFWLLPWRDSLPAERASFRRTHYRTHRLHFLAFLGGGVRMPWEECSVVDERLQFCSSATSRRVDGGTVQRVRHLA